MHRLQVEAGFLTNGSWPHLAGRFFRSLSTKSLSSEEADWVRSWLQRERVAFFAQPELDQLHAYRAGRLVATSTVGRPEVIRAALLHDVGKRHSQLSVIGRSLVTGLAKLGLVGLVDKPGGRADLYLRHGELGAEELTSLGAEPIVIDYARWHHHTRPNGFEPDTWEVLAKSDR